jgi:hypothetical protein
MSTKFLNVDLEIGSRAKLDPLAVEMGDQVFVLYSGRMQGQNFLSVETNRQHKGPDGLGSYLFICHLKACRNNGGEDNLTSLLRQDFKLGQRCPGPVAISGESDQTNKLSINQVVEDHAF